MKQNFKNLIYALLTIFASSIDYISIYNNGNNYLKYNLIIVILLVITIYIFYTKIEDNKLHYLKKILCILFSIFMLLGYSYNRISSYDLVFGNLKMMIISIISFIGYYIFFKKIFNLLNVVLFQKIKLKENKAINKISKFIDEKPFISSMIVILLFWLIYIIAFYPIILSPDPSFQIKQFFNVHTKYADWVNLLDKNVFMTNHHPVLHTLLLGGCLKLGGFLINDNFGLFIYSFIQIIILASTLSYTIKYLKKVGVNNKIRMFLLFIYALVPMFPFYAMSGVKDTIYSSFVIIYVIFLFEFIRDYQNKKLTIKQIVLIVLLLLLIALFRNNGMYIIILSFPFIILYSKVNRKKTISILMCFLVLFMTYSKIVLPYFKIADGSIREVLSIPFQQTARYTFEHSDELTKDEIKTIDKVLEYDTLADRYNPELADPVKNKYNKDTTKEELNDYFKVWLNGLIKHPTTYIEATMNNVYGYFYPGDTNWYIYNKYDTRITQDNLVDYHYNSLSGLRTILAGYGIAFPYIPIVGFLSNIGFNSWLLMIMGVYLFVNKKKKYLIPLLPLYATLLICVASPANTYFRYTMPYVFAMPFLVIMFIYIIKGKLGGNYEKKYN